MTTQTPAKRNPWVHVIQAQDGLIVRGFHTRAKAEADIRQYVTVEGALEKSQTFYSDNGSSHFIDELQDGCNTATYRKLQAAYDAREMGTLTKAQTALLSKWGW